MTYRNEILATVVSLLLYLVRLSLFQEVNPQCAQIRSQLKERCAFSLRPASGELEGMEMERPFAGGSWARGGARG